MNGWLVYIIDEVTLPGDTRHVVKVGLTSGTAKKRAAALQAGNARELIAAYQTERMTKGEAEALESGVQRWLSECWIRGENFACSVEHARHAIERWLHQQQHPLSVNEEFASAWSGGSRPEVAAVPRHRSVAAHNAHANRRRSSGGPIAASRAGYENG